MTIKKYDVSIGVWGRVKTGVFLREIEADSEETAVNRAVSKMCASGVYSPRVCALLKDAAKKYNRRSRRAHGVFHGVEVLGWAIESCDKGEGKSESENK